MVVLNRSQTLAQYAEPVVECDHDDVAVRRHDTSVVRVSGSGVKRLAVNKYDNRK